MTMPAQASAPTFLPLRYALRELRGGLRGFYVFIACIALGVMAIAGVGSIADSLSGGLAREGRVILGGDIAFYLSQREATASERQFLRQRGTLSTAATMRAMARTQDGRSALVEIKAVDNTYPLFGQFKLDEPLSLARALEKQGDVFGAAADPALLSRLDLKPGAKILIGSATLEIRAAIANEPDKLAGGIGFGPRLLISDEALRATGLVQPGSLVRWHYRLRLPDSDSTNAALTRLANDAQARFPDAGWEIRTRNNASPQIERNVERFTQFLTMVGLTALLVGGVGVANAIRSHLDRKRATIATMKSFGATGRRIFAIYLTQIVALAGIGAAVGALLGAALPFVLASLFGAILPLPIEPALYPGQLALAFVYGVFTAITFALWPLGRAHDIPASALFRDIIEPDPIWPRRIYVIAAGGAAILLAVFAVSLAYDRKVGLIFVAAAVATFAMLRLVSLLIMWVASRLPHLRTPVWRLAVANIHRPGAITPSIVLSLGIGIALLVTVIEIDGNLRRQFVAALPEKAPSFFFLDIQSADVGRFDAFIQAEAPGAKIERVPMLRGRIVSANGVKAEDLKPASNAAWVLQSDRGITYTDTLPAGSRLAEGQWWPADYSGPPLLSIETKIAEGLNLKIGDSVVVNVLGRNISATIANTREVDWQSLGINFVLVFSPNTFRGAPHTSIATLTFANGESPQAEASLIKTLAQSFPTITSVRVKDALDAIAGIVNNLVLALRGASVITVLSAMLVLAGALAASHQHRVYDAVILKTLGATRMRLIGAYALEYFLLGFATALFGVFAGSVAAWLVIKQVMGLSFVWLPVPALITACVALLVTVIFGLAGTLSALGQKPASVLRNL